ncbi:hypothetical protein CH299_27630 [Rhodococcus sp. 14-2686-1-2]|nr:hypothetical protein CH301_27110 [Rhodococcus sp. 15-1189-1-1a]OZF08467.1 hypothetical protein CH299_27630 [Rhodococcus sp. 14-2686-1-2]
MDPYRRVEVWQDNRRTTNKRRYMVGLSCSPPPAVTMHSGCAPECIVTTGIAHRCAESHVRVGPFAKKRAGVLASHLMRHMRFGHTE